MTKPPSDIAAVATPATRQFIEALGVRDWAAAFDVLEEHWVEIWYAVDPTDLRELLMPAPAAAFAHRPNSAYVLVAAGGPDHRESTAAEGPPADPTASEAIDALSQQVAELRLQGCPAEALTRILARVEDLRRLRGPLVDSSQGHFAVWSVQAGITAMLAGDLIRARSFLLEAANTHRPDRFPFVIRDATAKLALAYALGGRPQVAEEWMTRARSLERSTSWVEQLVDDTLWLADYVVATDRLELERAEKLRHEHPSPLSHLEFWGVALQAQVRHLVLTHRAASAVALCEEMAAAGLPLRGSDGWLAHMLSDARALCDPHYRPVGDAADTGSARLARRVRLFSTGQFQAVAARPTEETEAPEHDVRSQLALRLLRGQCLIQGGRAEEGRQVLQDALHEVMDRELFGVVIAIAPSLLPELPDSGPGRRARALLAQHDLPAVMVTDLLTSPLSEAEITVLRLLQRGMSRRQMADRLYVSVNTVKSHLASAYRKLGVGNRNDALAKAAQLDL